MSLNRLENFIKNTEGKILYVNPNDLDSTDSITNQGNSLAQPFKTIQRALLEAARFSYVKGSNNDIVEKTTILLFPGEHVIDNRPGFGIKDVGGTATAVDRSGSTSLASAVFSLGLDSNFDITSSDNILYKFNSYYGGVIVPRGTSIVGLDLRKTKIRPKYVPNPTDTLAKNSSIFKITGACYFWQFSFFDGDLSSTVYTNPDNFGAVYQSTPNFSHHKLTCFEYADGVNSISDFGLTDLDMYYSKVANAYNAYRDIDQKFPTNSEGFAKSRSEWEIVGAFSSDPIDIATITSSGSVVTVTTADPHELNVGTPIKIKGVSGSGVVFPYNISTTVQNVLSSTSFTYLLPSLSSYPTINTSPSAADATVTIETDTVSGASPYIFNCSMRSVWGMNGLHADGSKASGFRSVVVAQFTGVSLQKDDRAFAKYNKSTQTYESITPITAVYGSNLSNGSSSTTSSQVYHLDSDAVYRNGWETSHIKITNDAFIQIVSIFAIGFNKHFDAESGGDGSITNSNSNFGQISLSSSGFKKEAFDKDNNAFITSIVPPRAIVNTEEDIEWLSLDVGITTTVGISSHLYLYGFNAQDSAPFSLTQGYRVGARTNDKLYANLGAGTSEASIYMCDNEISSTGLTTALGTTSSVKSYVVTSGPTSNSLTIGSNNLLTGEKVKILSDTGNLPENIEPHETYYVINNGDNNTIKLASSKSNAEKGQAVTIYGGSNLSILSRVSDKDSGELGSPIQFDAQNNNWFIHVNANNQIYSALSTGGVATYGTSTDFAYIKRITDERSLDEKLYKLRVVIPKELSNAKNPEIGFVIQETSTTGLRTDTDFTKTSIGSSEYQYKKNPRFIASCSVVSSTVTVISELPHNLQVNDVVIVRNVKCSNNTSGAENLGYNGRFRVSGISNAYTFTYSTTDLNDVLHNPGTFTSDVNTRNTSLPRFERNDLQSNLHVYRNEVISPYIDGNQDGIYHLYVLNANNAIDDEFTNLKFGQSPNDLYPQLDRDNIEANPRAAKTYAKRSPIGAVVTNDLKKSITRETADLTLKNLGIGKAITSVTPTSAGLSTITFSRFHGLSGIVTYNTLTGGSGHTNGTYYNVRLYNEVGLSNWDGATAKVTVSGNAVTGVDIISGGSGYTNGETLYFDNAQIGGTVDASITIATSGISTNIGDVVQVTGIGTTTDGYYRIASVPSTTSVALAKTAGDPEILSNQYAFIVGSSVKVNSSDYVSATGITTFTTATAHGLLAGHQFRVIDSSNNNLGDYIVEAKVGLTTFTAVTNASLSASNGYILKHGLSANEAISDRTQENFGVRQVSFYDSETFTLSSEITTGISITLANVGVGTALRLPLGSYIQIDNEILRVLSITGANTFTVSRGALGTDQETHIANSLVRKIKPVAIELRRPSILRASGHTFEYLGYGPGNYSTSLPQVQVKTLSEQEEFLSQSQERSGGVVVYTGMNNSGDFYNGNTKTSAVSGEVISYDIPIPTVTGQETGTLVSAFDELAIKGRLLVEGGASGSVLSQFNGPVTFNKDVRVKAPSIFSDDVKITDTTESTSTTTGALTVSGGVGIVKTLRVGGNINVSSGNINLTTGVLNIGNFFSGGTSRFNSTTQSTSKDTGALVVEGGVGIEKNLNVGGTLNVANTTQSTSKDTGALVVEGGIGIEKNVNVGGSLNVTNNLGIGTTNPEAKTHILVQDTVEYDSKVLIPEYVQNNLILNRSNGDYEPGTVIRGTHPGVNYSSGIGTLYYNGYSNILPNTTVGLGTTFARISSQTSGFNPAGDSLRHGLINDSTIITGTEYSPYKAKEFACRGSSTFSYAYLTHNGDVVINAYANQTNSDYAIVGSANTYYTSDGSVVRAILSGPINSVSGVGTVFYTPSDYAIGVTTDALGNNTKPANKNTIGKAIKVVGNLDVSQEINDLFFACLTDGGYVWGGGGGSKSYLNVGISTTVEHPVVIWDISDYDHQDRYVGNSASGGTTVKKVVNISSSYDGPYNRSSYNAKIYCKVVQETDQYHEMWDTGSSDAWSKALLLNTSADTGATYTGTFTHSDGSSGSGTIIRISFSSNPNLYLGEFIYIDFTASSGTAYDGHYEVTENNGGGVYTVVKHSGKNIRQNDTANSSGTFSVTGRSQLLRKLGRTILGQWSYFDGCYFQDSSYQVWFNSNTNTFSTVSGLPSSEIYKLVISGQYSLGSSGYNGPSNSIRVQILFKDGTLWLNGVIGWYKTSAGSLSATVRTTNGFVQISGPSTPATYSGLATNGTITNAPPSQVKNFWVSDRSSRSPNSLLPGVLDADTAENDIYLIDYDTTNGWKCWKGVFSITTGGVHGITWSAVTTFPQDFTTGTGRTKTGWIPEQIWAFAQIDDGYIGLFRNLTTNEYKLFAWGDNEYGLLGTGQINTSNATLREIVLDLPSYKIKDISIFGTNNYSSSITITNTGGIGMIITHDGDIYGVGGVMVADGESTISGGNPTKVYPFWDLNTQTTGNKYLTTWFKLNPANA